MVKSNALILVILLILVQLDVLAQKDRYMVFFKDKAGTPYSINQPEQFLSQSAIARRVKHSVDVEEMDLPVNPAYVDQVKNTGAEVYFSTRWMNGVLVQCESTIATAIAAMPVVDHVEMVAPNTRLSPAGRKRAIDKKKSTGADQVTDRQLSMIGLDKMHQDNIRGEGILIAILDAGFPGVDQATAFQHLFNENRINLDVSKDFVTNSGSSVFQFDDHGTEVFSVIAGYLPDQFTGGAYKASFQLYVTEDVATEYRIEEYNWLFAAERADSAGVDIIQSSLGYNTFDDSDMDYLKSQMDGESAVISRAANLAAARGIVIVVSAGNEGNISWQIITAPADSEDVLAVANVDAQGNRSRSSSIGPSADQRIKPDVAALGTGTRVIEKSGIIGDASGTSLAAPSITSLAAGVIQRFPGLTNKQVLAAIRKSASQANRPDNYLGYGIPNYVTIKNYLEQQDDFLVYPNPFESNTQQVIIRPKDSVEVSACSLELISFDGKSVYKDSQFFSVHQELYSPDMTNQSVGIYLLRIGCPTKKYIYKIVKR